MIRLYAHLQGSFRTVSEGLKLAFTELSVLSGYVVGEAQDFDEEPVAGATAPIAVVVGDPMRVLLPRLQGEHKEVWLLLAPNSAGIPPELKQQLKATRDGVPTVDGFLAPSHWAALVLKKEFPDHPVELCQHGILPCFRVMDTPKAPGILGLHVTSTRLSRKGTYELAQAWQKLHGFNSSCQLKMLSNPQFMPELLLLVKDLGAENCITVENGQNRSWSDWCLEYNRAHLVIQPSRAEGFGLVPLEARACGVPVVATDCTGHDDHMIGGAYGCSIIPHGPVAGSDDFWGAVAPTVSVKSVYLAIADAIMNLDQMNADARTCAEVVQEMWTWTRGAAPVVQKWRNKYDRRDD